MHARLSEVSERARDRLREALAMMEGRRSRNHPRSSFLAALLILMFCSLSALIPFDSGVMPVSSKSDGDNERSQRRGILMSVGSRPPGCENKCLSCRPCVPTLVVPTHEQHQMKPFISSSFSSSSLPSPSPSLHEDNEDSYYLVSWKCTCGNQIFHP